MNELLKSMVCSGSDCLCWILVLLNIFAVFYLVYCSFWKISGLSKISGWVYMGVLICATILILFFHTCIYTLLATIFTGMMLMAILSIILPQQNEQSDTKGNTMSSKSNGAYLISETLDGWYVFGLYDSKRKNLINSTYTYESLEKAKEAIKSCRENGIISETEERYSSWIQEKYIPKFQVCKYDDKYGFSLYVTESESIINSKMFNKIDTCLAFLKKVKANIGATDVYLSVDKISGDGYKRWVQPIEKTIEEESISKKFVEESVFCEASVPYLAEVEYPTEKEIIEDDLIEDELIEEELIEEELIEEELIEEELIEEELDEENSTEENIVMPIENDEENSKAVYITYNRSFTAKLIQSSDDIKTRYSKLKNTLLAYGLKTRMSWTNESFRLGTRTLAKFGIKGKTLSAYLKLNPSELADTKYNFEDASDVKRYSDVPLRLKLRSERSVKWASELVELMMAKLGCEKKDYTPDNFALEYKTTEALVIERLIKVFVSGEGDESEYETANFEVLRREKFKQLTVEPAAEEEPTARI